MTTSAPPELNRERAELEPIVEKARQYRQALQRQQEARDLLEGDDPELRELAELELAELETQIPALEKELKTMLLPKDPRDEKNVIMEIRADAGG